MAGCKRFALLIVIALLLSPQPSPATAADERPRAERVDISLASIGVRRPPLPPRTRVTEGVRPTGFRLAPAEVLRIAARTEAVRDRPEALTVKLYTRGPGRWQASYFSVTREVAQVHVDDADGRVLEAWSGSQVGVKMARGLEGAFGGKVNSPWVWLPLCALFLAPFVDPRRPFRLLHLDLLVLLSFGVSQVFFNNGEIAVSVPLAYPPLAYLLARLLWEGFRAPARHDLLVPYVRATWLAAGLVGLVAVRLGLNVADSNVIDVGYAGVIGADLIADGESLYDGGFPDVRGDTYGPLNYLLYVPFEQVFGWTGAYDSLPAAHAVAIVFDLITVIGLLVLGPRLRPGSEGRLLGLALAFAWAAYPYTALALSSNSNDTIVASSLVWALVAVRSPGARGALIAAGAAAKLAPLALAPLFAVGTGERSWRSVAVFAGVLTTVLVAVTVPFVPDGGLSELYDRTLGYQSERSSPFSLWGIDPTLDPLQPAVRAAAVLLALLVAAVPRRRNVTQVAALGAAVIIALQLGATHWFYIYLVWFAPLAFAALFAGGGRPVAPPVSVVAGTETHGAR